MICELSTNREFFSILFILFKKNHLKILFYTISIYFSLALLGLKKLMIIVNKTIEIQGD